MKNKVSDTKNMQRLWLALGRLEDMTRNVPVMTLLSAPPGFGKTTATVAAVVALDAVFVRANSTATASSILEDICFELEIDGKGRNNAKFKRIVRALKAKPRPLFIDEIDRIVNDFKALEVLRDIHDIANVPVALIGTEDLQRKVSIYPQLSSRVLQHIVFKPCDLADAALVAKDLCEVDVAEDLIKKMHKRTNGVIRLIVIALTNFESFARNNGWKSITAEQWGDRPMFLDDKGGE